MKVNDYLFAFNKESSEMFCVVAPFLSHPSIISPLVRLFFAAKVQRKSTCSLNSAFLLLLPLYWLRKMTNYFSIRSERLKIGMVARVN